MSARTAGRRRHEEPAEFDDPDEGPADGVVVRVAARVMENPAMSGGLLVMALTAVAVVSNALFLQRAQHPEPWFATRPAVATTPAGESVAVPDPRPRYSATFDPPSPPAAPATAPATPPQLVADLQRALAARGLYDGKVDGLFGARTRAAIAAYEKAQGMAITGEPSSAVLAHMAASPMPAAAPAVPDVPAPPAPVAAAPEPDPPAAKVVAADTGAAEAEALLSYPPKAAPAVATLPEMPVAATPAAVVANDPDPVAAAVDLGAQRTLSVQKALNQIGYGPVPEDGVAGEGTIAAIRRFELDNGLPVTGAASDTLISRLVAIGALEAA